MIRDVDHGYKKLVRSVYGMQKRSIEVGILDATASTQDGNLTVLEVAIFNEFGTSHIPARSFLRAWFDENEGKIKDALVIMCKAVLAGKYDRDQALELLAQKFVGEIRANISAGIPPPNKPSTVRKKGSDTPLIDTGVLRSSITSRVK